MTAAYKGLPRRRPDSIVPPVDLEVPPAVLAVDDVTDEVVGDVESQTDQLDRPSLLERIHARRNSGGITAPENDADAPAAPMPPSEPLPVLLDGGRRTAPTPSRRTIAADDTFPTRHVRDGGRRGKVN